VILVAATNRPDVLDPAMLRPGRFDRHVVVNRPDVRGREAILGVHTRRVLVDPGIDLNVIARSTPGFSGADLENLVNEAALQAARRDGETVSMEDFELAKDKVLLGSERRSMVMTDEERRITAYHEAGHALVAMKDEFADPIHKVTIVPRGMALGVTQMLPSEDRYTTTRDQLRGMIRYAMGGRAAEDLIFEHLSTGAADDLKKATAIARDMVCRFGMSDRIGPVSLSDDSSSVFLGRDLMQHREHSEQKAREIDEEIGEILSSAYGHAKSVLDENRDVLGEIAEALLERETLGDDELQLLLSGEPLPPIEVAPAVDDAPPAPAGAEHEAEAHTALGGKGIPDPEPLPG
jgi:cell division protease FtsH